MFNINHGHNADLMKKCRILEEYAKFVEISRAYAVKEENKKAAFNKAIDYCIENGILEEFLRKYRMEVVGMLLEEFDADKYEISLKAEGYSEGDAERLIKCVEEIMKNMKTELPRACEMVGVTTQEYQKAREKYVGKQK